MAERRGGQEAMLVVWGSLLMVVPVDQDLRRPGRMRRVLLRLKDMRSQPEQLRNPRKGKEEKRDGESLPEQHAGIVCILPREVNRRGRSCAPGPM